MVCNLKTDSNLEFGCPNTAEERERSAREVSNSQRPLKGPPVKGTWGSRPQHPFAPWGSRASHGDGWCGLFLLATESPPFSLLNIFLLPSKFCMKKNWKRKSVEISSSFWFLILILTLSFELRIKWFKIQKCWSWREEQTPSIFQNQMISWFWAVKRFQFVDHHL